MMLHKSIYALCDFASLQKYDVSQEKFLQICSKFDVAYIQYRDKLSSIEDQKKNLFFLQSNTNIPIIINDKLELLEYANGLHMGQEDVDELQESMKLKDRETLFKFLRKKYPDKIFGLSTHNEKEILETNILPLDYIGLGAYRQTSTKDVSNLLGDKISYLAKISKHPVGAIGGVKIEDNIENIRYNVIGSDLLKHK
jgi:thiamine-phosphate pyrophosphorylase